VAQAALGGRFPAFLDAHLEVTARFRPERPTFSDATHICTCEVDAETGFVRLLRYVVSEDCGVMINPNVVHGQVAGEEYLPLGAVDVKAVVEKIAAAKPNAILSTINGDTNAAFFRELRAAGIASAQVPTISFSIAEAELQAAGARDFAGDYAAWSYFQSLPGDANRVFVERYRRRYGAGAVTDDPMEAAYVGVHLWAQAVAAAGTDEPEAVMAAVRAQAYPGPEGMVYVDPKTLHLWKTPRLGQIQPDGQFAVVWSDRQTPAAPFPLGRSKMGWAQLADGLYKGWGNAWSAPTARAPP